jgi:hypothetical protein
VTDPRIKEALIEVKRKLEESSRTLDILKGQGQNICEDIAERREDSITVEEAYTAFLRFKLMKPSATLQKKVMKFDNRIFSQQVLQYCRAAKLQHDDRYRYCHLFGWLPECLVECVHLVPKRLGGTDLGYLLGSDEALLSEARNGMFHCIVSYHSSLMTI